MFYAHMQNAEFAFFCK